MWSLFLKSQKDHLWTCFSAVFDMIQRQESLGERKDRMVKRLVNTSQILVLKMNISGIYTSDKQPYKWSTLSDRELGVFCQGGTHTHSGHLQAGGRSLGKVTNSHTPLLQHCQQSLISLCLHKHSLSGPERKVVTSPVVFWIAPVPRAAPSTATAGIQQLWILIWKFAFV